MSLNWDISRIENYKELCWLPDGKDDDGEDLFRLNPDVDSLIWSSLVIGLGSITRENVHKWYERFALLETLHGAQRRQKVSEVSEHDGEILYHWEDVYWQPEELVKFIGLSTNVSAKTDAKFRNEMVKEFNERKQRAFDKAIGQYDPA